MGGKSCGGGWWCGIPREKLGGGGRRERGEGRGVGIRGGGGWIVEGRIDGRNKGILDFREVKEWVDDSGVGGRD